MIRRTFLAATTALAAPVRGATEPAAPTKLGLTIASYTRYRSTVPSERFPGWKDALAVLDHCADLGAGCLQIGVEGWSADFANKMRTHREALGIRLEGQVSLPKNESDTDRFRSACHAAKEAGATILRTVCLGGRRYETFKSLAEWTRFCEQSWTSLTLAEPIVRKLGMKLAIENHKDWRTDEFLDLLKRLDSEAVGVNFDFGNNVALLEDPHPMCEALAPWLLTTHVKDMGVQLDPTGLYLAEVPLGDGCLDLPRLIATCRKANPDVQFNLEMITRDPLVVPVLTQEYFATMPALPATDLARTLLLVQEHYYDGFLPRISKLRPEERLDAEEQNVRRSFAHARQSLAL